MLKLTSGSLGRMVLDVKSPSRGCGRRVIAFRSGLRKSHNTAFQMLLAEIGARLRRFRSKRARGGHELESRQGSRGRTRFATNQCWNFFQAEILVETDGDASGPWTSRLRMRYIKGWKYRQRPMNSTNKGWQGRVRRFRQRRRQLW
jgi:hypothetical protein